MPAPRAKVLRKRENNARLESVIQEGCRLLAAHQPPRYSAVHQDLERRYGINVPYHTLRNRFLGKSKAPEDAHANQQFLSPEQERVLADWLQHLGDTGHPLDKRSIREAARAIAGKLPSRGWVRLFCARHPNIVMGKGSSLDPKRAQAFNRPVVTRHFELLKKIMEEHGIPWENVYNMDEKGCQRGSRKGSNRKHFFARNKRPKYKIRSGNLELVTIIECVCADGSSLLPGFVFPGNGNYCPEWFTVDPKIS